VKLAASVGGTQKHALAETIETKTLTIAVGKVHRARKFLVAEGGCHDRQILQRSPVHASRDGERRRVAILLACS